MTLQFQQHAHRRLNALTGRWVLVSPHRTVRPWQGQIESAAPPPPAYDPSCYMCPGNRRAQGERNPEYASTFVFDNDFPALVPHSPPMPDSSDGLIVACGARGVCRVVCFSPRHDLTLARMELASIRAVVDCWVDEYLSLSGRSEIAYVQIFENRGAMMGASNPHPHGQIWATSFVPDEIETERTTLARYAGSHASDLLGDYITLEEQTQERLVASNDYFVCVVPFWAIWPFETLIVPRRLAGALDELTDAERAALAEMLQRVTNTYDALFHSSFPYSMGLHVRPALSDRGFRLHLHFYPPLLRSATIRKFMVGFELLAMPQRDLTPERAAEALRLAAS